MIRWILVVFLTLGPCLAGCARHYTYLSYKVVRTSEELRVGDEIRIAPKAGGRIQGTLVRIEGSRLTIAADGSGERTVDWKDIRVLERVRDTRITVY